MSVTQNCPKCGRLAYMQGGVCEFCGSGQDGRGRRSPPGPPIEEGRGAPGWFTSVSTDDANAAEYNEALEYISSDTRVLDVEWGGEPIIILYRGKRPTLREARRVFGKTVGLSE